MSQPPALRIEGARQNNLKNVSVEIPHDRLTVVTGVSGSGKSSLAFDTLFAEGQWRYIESHRGHRDRDLRLPPTALREGRPGALRRLRGARRQPPLGDDHRRRPAGRARRRAGPRDLSAAGPDGRAAGGGVGRPHAPRIRARPPGRRGRGPDDAAARHAPRARARCRAGSRRAGRRRPRAPRGLAGDGAARGRRAGRGGRRGRHAARVHRGVPLRGVRRRARAAAAAALLLQPPAGRLRGVQGLRQRAQVRRVARRPRSRAQPRLGRDRAMDATATASSPASTASSRRSSPTATSCTCASSSRATAPSPPAPCARARGSSPPRSP